MRSTQVREFYIEQQCHQHVEVALIPRPILKEVQLCAFALACLLQYDTPCNGRHPAFSKLHTNRLSPLRQNDVGTSSDTELVNTIALIPDTTLAFNHRDHFLRDSLSQAVLATSHVPPLGSSAENPLDGCSPSLPLGERNWDLQRHTTTSSTLLRANSKKRGDRVDSECEVKNGV